MSENIATQSLSDEVLIKELKSRVSNAALSDKDSMNKDIGLLVALREAADTLESNLEMQPAVARDKSNDDIDSNDFILNQSAWLRATDDEGNRLDIHIVKADSLVRVDMFTGPDLEYLEEASASAYLDFEPAVSPTP